MEINYRIKIVTSKNDKDLMDALEIYLHSIDEKSETDSLQIRDYIQNKYKDIRKMFFYILYANGNVVGFAEYGYLPESEAIIMDYLCTAPRTPAYFYNFYHMILNDMGERLKKEHWLIKYIITELSAHKDKNNRYVDTDSNYFRQMLTAEGFKILKTPYYQPYLNTKKELSFIEFNVAIKPLINGLFAKTTIDKIFYQGILEDIYINHYANWYEKFMEHETVAIFFDELIAKIDREFPDKIEIDDITLVNCALFQEGLCRQISSDNITLKRRKEHRRKRLFTYAVCIVFSTATFFCCFFEYLKETILNVCSALTIISSITALFQYLKGHSF